MRIETGRASHGATRYANEGFRYELSRYGLSIGYRHLLLRLISYAEIDRAERGWAPGWEPGGLGMPLRGDEVRIRLNGRRGLPWLTVTPAEPDAFLAELREGLAAWREAEEPAVAMPAPVA